MADYKEVIEKLRAFSSILVTGPSRSGTWFATNAIAQDLGYEAIREDCGSWSFEGACQCLLRGKRVVAQSPNSVVHCHRTPAPVAVVFMWRPIPEIVASMRRIGIGNAGKIFAYGLEKIVKSSPVDIYKELPDLAPAVGYAVWDHFQSRVLGARGFSLDYHSMEGHPLWVPKAQRVNFTSRQLKVGEPTT